MYPTININGQRVNLNNIAGFRPTKPNNVCVDLHGGMDENGEGSYIFIPLTSKEEQRQVLEFIDKHMNPIKFEFHP